MQSRRTLLTALSAFSLGVLVPLDWLQPLTAGRSLAERIASLFSDHVQARAVGDAHLKSRPGNTVVSDVVRRLVGDADQHTRLMRTGDRALHRYFEVQRERDFECGRTVCIDGWVLSETEANLCAVVALLPSSQRGDEALAGLHV